MLSYKILTTDEEFQEYARLGNPLYNIEIPFEYFRRGKILAFFKDSRMVGGAALITEGPFRSLAIIPDEIKANSGVNSIPPHQIVEVNAVWLSKEISALAEVIQFWHTIVRETRSTRKRWSLVPYNEMIGGLERLYAPAGLKVLFRGAPLLASHKRVVIGICRPSDLYKCFIIQATIRAYRSIILRKPARGTRGGKAQKGENPRQAFTS